MRLLILSQYFWPENFRVNDLVAALAGRGHEVTVLTGEPNYPKGEIFAEYLADPQSFGRYGRTPVVRVPLLPRGQGSTRLILNYASFVITASTLGVWKLRRQAFDAIFVYLPSPVTAGLPAIVIGWFKRAPVLLWTLDLWPETLEAVGAVRNRGALALVGKLVSFIYRRCALVLGQSRGFAANVRRYSCSSEKFRYFPQWSEPIFDADIAAVEPAPEVRAFSGTFNVLFAGNIGEAQDFPAILHAAAVLRDHPNLRWLIVGDGRAAESVRHEITRRGLDERVFLLGRYPLERMPAFFRVAGALLVTLKREPVFALTIPGKLQAYLASGLPLLGMLDGEGAKVIDDSGAGFSCAAGDGAALASQVERMMALSAAERAEMGRRALEYSEREFAREPLLTLLEGWLRDASERHPTLCGTAGAS